MGEREEYLARAEEAERLALDSSSLVIKEALLEMAKAYRQLALRAPKAAPNGRPKRAAS